MKGNLLIIEYSSVSSLKYSLYTCFDIYEINVFETSYLQAKCLKNRLQVIWTRFKIMQIPKIIQENFITEILISSKWKICKIVLSAVKFMVDLPYVFLNNFSGTFNFTGAKLSHFTVILDFQINKQEAANEKFHSIRHSGISVSLPTTHTQKIRQRFAWILAGNKIQALNDEVLRNCMVQSFAKSNIGSCCRNLSKTWTFISNE